MSLTCLGVSWSRLVTRSTNPTGPARTFGPTADRGLLWYEEVFSARFEPYCEPESKSFDRALQHQPHSFVFCMKSTEFDATLDFAHTQMHKTEGTFLLKMTVYWKINFERSKIDVTHSCILLASTRWLDRWSGLSRIATCSVAWGISLMQ